MAPPLPPPLPPETRTVGQLVAETVRLYGQRFWRALPLGLSVAAIDQLLFNLSRGQWFVFMVTVGAFLLTLAYVGAAALAAPGRLTPRSGATALVAGMVAFLPFPFLVVIFLLPGFAWLALVGLVVPVAVVEGTDLRGSFRRALQLARTDYVHALGSLATLAITYFLTRLVLVLLLRGSGDQTARIAVFLGDLVISPILFLGAALLYFDQAARAQETRGRGAREGARPAL